MDIVLQIHDQNICNFCRHMECNNRNFTKIIHIDGDLDHCVFEISKKIEDNDENEYQQISSISRISCPLSCHFTENSTRDKCSIEALEFDCPPFPLAQPPPLQNIHPPFLPPPFLLPAPSPPPIKSPCSEEFYPKPPFFPILESPSPPFYWSNSPSPPSTDRTSPQSFPISPEISSQTSKPSAPPPPSLQQKECQSSEGCDVTSALNSPASHQYANSIDNQYLLYIIITLAALLIFLLIIIKWVVFKTDKKIKEMFPQIEMISV